MEMNMSPAKNGNELAKPLAINGENIYPTPQFEQMGAEVVIQKQIIIEQPMVEQSQDSDRQIGSALAKNLYKIEQEWASFERFISLWHLMVTIGICCLSYFNKSFFQFQMEQWWGSIVAIVLMYTVMGVIVCCGGQRVYPYNMGWLFLFTICFSYLISQVTSVYAYCYGGPLVLTAAGLTLLVVIALTLFAIFSRNDFRFLWAAAVATIASMIGFGILCIFDWSPVLYQLYSALVVALLGILLVVDTKLILGGNRGFEISMDNYILGALVIYIDIMRIFLVILRMLGARK